MVITQRQVVIGALVVVTGGNVLFSILLGLDQRLSTAAVPAISAIINLILLRAYLRGWSHATNILIVIASVVVSSASSIIPKEGIVSAPIELLFPAALALVMTTPPWLVVSAILTAIIYFARVFSGGFAPSVFELITYIVLVTILLLARAVLNTTARQADEARKRAEQAQVRTEEQARALEAANAAQQAQLDEQRRLLDLVATLETPAITLADGVLFAPVVGYLDSNRAARLTTCLLEAAHNQRTHHVIIDISGVSTVDTMVAQVLIQTAQALKLLGCRVTLSGISSEVALTLTQQNVLLHDIATVRSPQEALMMEYGQ